MPFTISDESFVIHDVDTTSMVTYHRDYFEGALLLRHLHDAVEWQTERPIIYGKSIEVKRKTAAFGTPGLTYRYSGMTKVASPWLPALIGLKNQLSRDAGVDFNFCLANFYPDGSAGIGRHADSEPEMEPGSPIATISLGASRTFVLYRDGKKVTSVVLEHGSALIMWLETQKHYQHGIPAQKSVRDPRISLTFRCFR